MLFLHKYAHDTCVTFFHATPFPEKPPFEKIGIFIKKTPAYTRQEFFIVSVNTIPLITPIKGTTVSMTRRVHIIDYPNKMLSANHLFPSP